MKHTLKFLAEVAFFGGGATSASEEEAFPEELKLSAEHICRLIQSLRYEQTREVDLLEVFVKMLTEVHPNSEISFGLMLEIIETSCVLLE